MTRLILVLILTLSGAAMAKAGTGLIDQFRSPAKPQTRQEELESSPQAQHVRDLLQQIEGGQITWDEAKKIIRDKYYEGREPDLNAAANPAPMGPAIPRLGAR